MGEVRPAGRLLAADVAARILAGDRYAPSHGADARRGYLGAGALYYGIAYALRARLCVCLGSGSGFVPKLMRQAQRDAGLGPAARTLLVDAAMAGCCWGEPDPYHHDPAHPFRAAYPEVEVVEATTEAAAARFRGEAIDYLHVDADHSEEGVLRDLALYGPLLSVAGVITLHDTNPVWSKAGGVYRALDALRAEGGWDVCDLWHLWHGVAVVRRRR